MNRNPDSHCATWGWVAIGVFAAGWDAIAPETLSDAADRALEKHPVLTIATIGAVAMHLANTFEHYGIEKLDPISQIGNVAVKLYERLAD